MFGQKNKKLRVSKDDIKSSVRKANERFKSANKKLEAEIAKAKAELKALKAEMKDADKQAQNALSRVESCKSEISKNFKSLDKSRRDIKASQERLSRSMDEEKCVEINIDTLRKSETKLKRSVSALEKKLLERDGLAASIKNAKAEYKQVKKDLEIGQGELESLRTDSIAVRSAKDALDAEFDAFKKNVELQQEEISSSISSHEAEKIAKDLAHKQHIKLLETQMADKKEEADSYNALAKKAQDDYIAVQSKILAGEKRLEKTKLESELTIKRQQDAIDNIKSRYENWKLNELDQVAKMKLKGKIENIDKAGLKEILDA
jgi:chromosome segregation ATPase